MRLARAASAFHAGLIGTVASLLIAMWSTPILASLLGNERMGLLRAIWDLVGYLSLLEFGHQSALQIALVRARAAQDQVLMARILRSACKRYGVITGLGLLLCGAAWPLYPMIISSSSDLKGELGPSLVGACLTFGLVGGSIVRVWLEAAQRGSVVQWTFLLQNLVTVLLAVWCAHLGWGMPGQTLAMFGGGVLGLLVMAFKSRDMLACLRQDTSGSREPLQLWRMNRPAFLSSLAGRICLASDHLLLAAFFGGAQVFPFYITQRLVGICQGQLQNFGNTIWAGMSEIHVRRGDVVFSQRALQATRFIGALGAGLLAPLYSFNEVFVRLWIGEHGYGGDLLNGVAVINAWFMGVFSLWGWLFTSTGDIRPLVPMMLTQAIVNLGASLILLKMGWLAGPALGTLCAFILVPLWWLPVLMRRSFLLPLRGLFAAMYRSALCGLLGGFLLKELCGLLGVDKWWELIVWAALVTPASLALSLALTLDTTERRAARMFTRRVFKL